MSTRDKIQESPTDAFVRASNGRAHGDRVIMDARVIEDLGLSSLDLLELRCELEERWELQVTDQELMQLRTVADVVRLIEGRMATPDS